MWLGKLTTRLKPIVWLGCKTSTQTNIHFFFFCFLLYRNCPRTGRSGILSRLFTEAVLMSSNICFYGENYLFEVLLMSTHNIWFLRELKIYISYNLNTLSSQSYELLVPGQVNWNFLLVLREMGQVGQVGHGISTALYLITLLPRATVNILQFCTPKFLIVWHMQTVQTQIRLLLREQSDQGLHCLPIHYVH